MLAAPPEEDPHSRSDVERLMESLTPRARDIVKSISLEGKSISATAARLEMTRGRGARRPASRAEIARRRLEAFELMRTEDLIAALAADTNAPVVPIGRRLAVCARRSAPWSALALFMTALGPAPDIAEAVRTMRFDLKFVDTLALLLPSALLCLRLSEPEASPGAIARAGSPRRSCY